MSNYTKTTNFASKDNLSPGNPLKIVKGAEIDTEFNNIATAVATKTDNASANITGGSITGITDLAIADGGTGASTATAALNNLLPSQTGNATKYLQTDGTNATWDAVSLSTSDITGTLPVANGGTGVTSSTGTGSVVLSNSPTLVTPALGTPASATLTNATGLPISTGVSGLGTGVATFLATPSSANLASTVSDETGSGALVFANSPTLVTPALGTPSSGTLTNATGLPISTGVSGLGTGVATFLATPSSANLISAVTDETGTGSLVFATSPTLVTPALGTPSSATLTNATGLPIATGVSGLGTGVATALAVNVGSAGAPVVNGGVLGTPSSGTATNLTGLPLSTGVTGTLPVANGGTGQTSYTDGQLLIGNTTGNTLAKATLTAGTGISITNGGGSITIATSGGGSGDVTGPASSTDNALARFDSTTGKIIQNSVGILSDTGAISGLTDISASGSVTLSGGTANGVTYLNGSKVLTSGSALTFDGNTFVSSRSTDGLLTRFAGASYGLTINSDVGAGIRIEATDPTGAASWQPLILNATNQIFKISNTEGMRLTSTGLGIGTSSPASKLDVQTAASTNGGMTLGVNGSMVGTLGSGGFSVNGGAITDFGIRANANMLFATGSGAPLRMTLDSSGNLGLGVTPSAWNTSVFKALQINAQGALMATSASMQMGNNVFYDGAYKFIGTGYANRYYQASGQHVWTVSTASGTAGNAITETQAMTLDASGNLGVGTTSPSQRLDATVSSSTEGSGLAVTNSLTGGYGSGVTFYSLRSDTSAKVAAGSIVMNGAAAWNSNASTSSSMIFSTVGANTLAERARIDSSGNLLVGTTTSSVTSGNGIKLIPGTASACNIVGSADTNANFAHTVYSTSPAAYRFQVGWGGTIYATSTSISAISDQTLKTNVRDLETGITEVMALKPRRFDWINGDATDVAGFIAQEVEQVLPELVDDYLYSHDEDGNNIIKKSLKMGDILPTLVKAIQEQQAIIESLKARLDAANL